MNDEEVRAHVAHVESLLEGLDQPATDAVAALVGLYGEALRRIVERLRSVPDVAEALAQDELVSHLLMLHDLHPASLEERVASALEQVQPYLRSHGGGVELIGVVDGVAHVRLAGTCSGCAASTATLKLAIEDAVLRAAPELHAVEAEDVESGVTMPGDARSPQLISLLPGGIVV